MLETVREYALERLSESGEEEFTRKAHAAYCLVLAEEAHTRSTPAERDSWLAACDAEHYNLRAGLAWLLKSHVADWALRMALALFDFWESREYLSEGCQLMQAALRLPAAAARTAVRAGVLWRAGAMLGFQGELEHSLQLHREALGIYVEVGAKADIAFQLSAIGACQMLMGDLADAVSSYEESVLLYRESGNASQIAQTLSNLAQARSASGDHAVAIALVGEAQAIFRDIEHRVNVAWCSNHLADMARALGEFSRARRLYQEGADMFRNLGEKWGLARSLSDLAELSSEERDHTTAHELFRQALALFLDLDHKRGVARTLEAMAIDAARQECARRALTLAGCAAGIRHRTGSCIRPGEKRVLESALVSVCDGFDSAESGEVWASARKMPLDDAVRYAVSRADATR
jgi:tetratricopeptide (TPR) repeat protein